MYPTWAPEKKAETVFYLHNFVLVDIHKWERSSTMLSLAHRGVWLTIYHIKKLPSKFRGEGFSLFIERQTAASCKNKISWP